MSESFIPASEFETASNAVSNILGQPVEEIKITDILPPLNDIADSNKVFKGKLSVLFVDMRKSTDLTDELKSKKMVKVYRSFIRIVIQAIRYSGGYTRQFAGDGIMGIFQNSNVDDQNISSSCKAIKAARYIHTLIDFCLNPALKKSMDICIGCGVGICTGTIMITKVGMRGKESNKTAENETGIVWVGSTTNYANRYCSLAHPCEIFIDENTYSEIEDSEIWTKTSRTKGNKVFEGYAVSEHYLSLPEEITAEAVKADTENDSEASFIQNIFAETQEKALLLVDEISKKSAELAIALEEAKKREGQAIARDNESRKENIRLQQWQKSWTAKTGAAKTCSPSPGSTSQGRKSRKAACPLHWCGILLSIPISAVWCCGLTTMPRGGSPQKPSRPCCRGSMRSRWTSNRPRRAKIIMTAFVCGWACPLPSAEKGAKNGERLDKSGTAHPALSYAAGHDAKGAGHRRRLSARNRRHPYRTV